jgi:prepilin-type N-terminal cleavage/methylation domain-containing protein
MEGEAMKRIGIISSVGFTMIEILISVVVLAVLVSVATVGYAQYRDRSAILIDESNQAVIQAAIKLYAYDNNALPGPLSHLTRDHFDRAYALVSDGKRPYTLFAHLQNAVGLTGTAEAAPLPNRYLGENPQKILTCPSDETPPAEGGVSYGISPDAANKPLAWMTAHPNDDLVVETDTASAETLAFRHGGGTISVSTSVSGEKTTKVIEGSTGPVVDDGSSDDLDRDGDRHKEGSGEFVENLRRIVRRAIRWALQAWNSIS